MPKRPEIFDELDRIAPLIPTPVYWLDINCVIIGGNDLCLSAIGSNELTIEEVLIGKTYYDYYPKEIADELTEKIKLVLKTNRTIKVEEKITDVTTGKFRYYETARAPLIDNGKIVGTICTAIEITDKKEAQEALKKAKEAAEAASTAKTEFIANMSHDIRTPLSGVVGLGNILEKEIKNPSAKAKVHDMVKSADELLNMLNEILDVVALDSDRVHEIHEEPFDLFYLVQTILDLEQSSVDVKNIKLLKSIDQKIPSILIGDHKKIHHILLNLVGNSIKFTKEGHVGINIKLSENQNDHVRLLFEVTDTGMGIPPEALDKIFELFYKITPSYKGLDKGHGIGLNIVKTYTELLGGKISVESKLNQGSKFYFTLTLKIADKSAKPKNLTHESLTKRSEEPPIFVPVTENKEPTSPAFSNAPEILVVEDNPMALTVVQLTVSNAKCNPTSASDGETALELAKTKHFDLILTDIGLPGISGTEFVQQLRQYEKEANKEPVPIVAITGHAEGEMRNECIAAGINEVYIKPLRPEMLNEICTKFSLFDNKNKKRALSQQLQHPLHSIHDDPSIGSLLLLLLLTSSSSV